MAFRARQIIQGHLLISKSVAEAHLQRPFPPTVSHLQVQG